jgi:photosystem II stability/assembly factor-like uncharacterized protein
MAGSGSRQRQGEAAPARAAALGTSGQRVYLLGRRDLYRSDDGGRSWTRIDHGLPHGPEFAALAVARAPDEVLYAVVDGVVMASQDAGRNWRPRNAGLPQTTAEALSVDSAIASRLWVASADRIYSSDDGGARWQPVGEPLPEPGTSVRGIAADASGRVLVITTHRGIIAIPMAGRPGAFSR